MYVDLQETIRPINTEGSNTTIVTAAGLPQVHLNLPSPPCIFPTNYGGEMTANTRADEVHASLAIFLHRVSYTFDKIQLSIASIYLHEQSSLLQQWTVPDSAPHIQGKYLYSRQLILSGRS
jgi:hypothetical protein